MPISLADIPDMEEDLDLGGLPSWNAKPKAKPAAAPTAKPTAATSNGSGASKYSAQEEAAAKYGAGASYSSSSSAASSYSGGSPSSSSETAAQRASRYGGGAYKPDEESAPSKHSSSSSSSAGGAKYVPAEEETAAQRASRYGGGSAASTSKYSDDSASKYSSGGYQSKTSARAAEPEPEPEPEEEDAPASGIDIAPLDMDERNRIAAQIEQELTLEGLGLPDYRKGDYGSAAAGKTRVVDKGVWTGSTNTTTGGPGKTRAQLLREGKEVLSVREQREAEAQTQKEEFAAAAVKMQCTYKGCTFQAVGKRGYCATHQIEHNQRLEATKAAAASSPRSTPGSAQYQAPSKHKCAGCKQPIVGPVVEALSAHWHETCFCCRGCGAEFPSGKFVNIKGQPHCRACAAATTGSEASGSGGTCKGCRKPLTSEGVEAMGASWHKQCFVCTHCGKPFPGGKFSSVKGEPFCNQQCFEARLGI